MKRKQLFVVVVFFHSIFSGFDALSFVVVLIGEVQTKKSGKYR